MGPRTSLDIFGQDKNLLQMSGNKILITQHTDQSRCHLHYPESLPFFTHALK